MKIMLKRALNAKQRNNATLKTSWKTWKGAQSGMT